MTKSPVKADESGLSLAERRAFMKLPVEERRRRMSEQAAQMQDHYKALVEASERET